MSKILIHSFKAKDGDKAKNNIFPYRWYEPIRKVWSKIKDLKKYEIKRLISLWW